MKTASHITDSARTRRIRLVATLLDGCLRIPGTKATIGLDPVLGMIPVAGDVISAAASLYIVYEAHKLGADRRTIGAMILNIAIDTSVGFIPAVGDLFDFAFKANTRNLRLLGLEPLGPLDLDPRPTPRTVVA